MIVVIVVILVIVVIDQLTPKAFANSAQGSRNENPGDANKKLFINPERVRQPRNPFRVESL